MTELEKHVRQLEDGRAKLDDAIGAYERGAQVSDRPGVDERSRKLLFGQNADTVAKQ